MVVTDNYVLFWGGVFSNFYPCKIKFDGHIFKSSEQLFMALKAIKFEDLETYDLILKAEDPKTAKKLGRKVKNFDESSWEKVRFATMKMVVSLKFHQNPKLRKELLSEKYKDKSFVEASPFDAIWGIKLSEDDPRAKDKSTWQGMNLLGKVLDEVREEILKEN